MSNPEEEKYLVVNQRDQPIELHLAERVLVLTPHGAAELDGSEIGSPQLQTLANQRLIMLEKKESEGDVVPAKKRSQPSGQTRKRTSTKRK